MKIKRLTDTAQLPTRASDGAAGLDLYADVPGAIAIYPGETKKIHTGIAVELRPYQVGLSSGCRGRKKAINQKVEPQEREKVNHA